MCFKEDTTTDTGVRELNRTRLTNFPSCKEIKLRPPRTGEERKNEVPSPEAFARTLNFQSTQKPIISAFQCTKSTVCYSDKQYILTIYSIIWTQYHL